jgi:hypothetical protein
MHRRRRRRAARCGGRRGDGYSGERVRAMRGTSSSSSGTMVLLTFLRSSRGASRRRNDGHRGDRQRRRVLGFTVAAPGLGLRFWGEGLEEGGGCAGFIGTRGGLGMRAHGQERARARCGTDPRSGRARCDRRWGMTGGPHLSATAGEGHGSQLRWAIAGPALVRVGPSGSTQEERNVFLLFLKYFPVQR